MQAIETLIIHLQNYPDVHYQITDSTIIVAPSTKIGFEVSLTENESHYSVAFAGGLQQFDNRSQAIDYFLLGLSDECRLQIVSQGQSPIGWKVQHKIGPEEWRDGYEYVATGHPLAKFWMRKQNVYWQNNWRKRIPDAPRLKEQDPANPQFMDLVHRMIATELIDYRHYYGWADEVILTHTYPPYWVHEIATARDKTQALTIIEEFLMRELNVEFYRFDAKAAVACLYLRYVRGEIDWLAFLRETKRFGGDVNNDLWFKISVMEDGDDDTHEFELQDRAEFAREHATAIATIAPLFDDFLPYFRGYQARPV